MHNINAFLLVQSVFLGATVVQPEREFVLRLNQVRHRVMRAAVSNTPQLLEPCRHLQEGANASKN